MKEKRYKFFTINQDGDMEAHPFYRINSNKSNEELGVICWCAEWRQFTFDPDGFSSWSADCLAGIIEFLNELNKENAEC